MKRIVFLILAFAAIPLLAYKKNYHWNSGTIRVLSEDQWCREGHPKSPDRGTDGAGRPVAGWDLGTCGPRRSDATVELQNSAGPAANPTTQMIEIDGPDRIYIVRRTGLDGGVRIRPDSAAEFAVDGKHLLLRFQCEKFVRGSRQTQPAEARTEILESRKR